MGIFGSTAPTDLREVKVQTYRRQPRHHPRGEPCSICGQPAENHRVRTGPRKPRAKKPKTNPYDKPFLGIDGEGIDSGPHKYTLLGVSDEYGKTYHLEDYDGLHTRDLLEFILELPSDQLIFSFAFNYDLTKILQDVDDETLYKLFRPELRARRGQAAARGPHPVFWKGFGLNLQGSKFEVFRKGGKSIIIWDIFKFFGSKFVSALKDWKVGRPELWERMANMKGLRDVFTLEMKKEIREYCLEECLCMAQLARKLYNAHNAAGLTLKNFYGAGSSAAAMLDKMGIKDAIVESPDEMRLPIASAFFGGRFENSVIGSIDGPVYNYDISSAYPYQLYRLPCLLHARWEFTKKRSDIDGARQALINFAVKAAPTIHHWGPFPYRDKDGNISYPSNHDGGWVWIDEYLAGEAGWPDNVQFLGAWVLKSDCDCHPFKDIAHYYNERCRIGKEGPGLVMKLGCNSCYGKIAQSVGNGVFNHWAWAGMITSGCRGQLLRMLLLHKDQANALMMATDGIFTRERLIPPQPIDTGTLGTGKPLGGWEEKVINKPVFIARPGIYFPMNPTKEQLSSCKGRGVGRSVVYENWQLISDRWEEIKRNGLNELEKIENAVKVANVRRFCGAKTSILRREITVNGKTRYEYSRADGHKGEKDEHLKAWPAYGEWVEREVLMSFHPAPKRDGVMEDGVSLRLRASTGISVPYAKANRGEESGVIQSAWDELAEQPDFDFTEVG